MRVAVTVLKTSMRITLGDVFPEIIVPVCSVAKRSVQENRSKPTVKPVPVSMASGTAKMSHAQESVKFMEMGITRLLILNGIALMDTVSTHL